jgi:hypothetical protein
MQKEKIMIGIDPDVTDNGVAIRFGTERRVILTNQSFWGLIDWLNDLSETHLLYVVVEAGHLNKKSNFRSDKVGSLPSDKISKSVGRNHQVGILISEYLDRRGIRYDFHIPRNKEIKECIENGQYFDRVFNWAREGPFNKETRSAAMLIYQAAYPINLGQKKNPASR